jgi:Asp-tRNA(Asn)/Glu-tRNA(Gln) amidotransferase A subunit family amidase
LRDLWSELDPAIVKAFEKGRRFDVVVLEKLRAEIAEWLRGYVQLLAPGVVLAMPTLIDWPPLLDYPSTPAGHRNGAVNAAGLPAICLPASPRFPFASLQLIGAAGTESMPNAAARRSRSRWQPADRQVSAYILLLRVMLCGGQVGQNGDPL